MLGKSRSVHFSTQHTVGRETDICSFLLNNPHYKKSGFVRSAYPYERKRKKKCTFPTRRFLAPTLFLLTIREIVALKTPQSWSARLMSNNRARWALRKPRTGPISAEKPQDQRFVFKLHSYGVNCRDAPEKTRITSEENWEFFGGKFDDHYLTVFRPWRMEKKTWGGREVCGKNCDKLSLLKKKPNKPSCQSSLPNKA